jgi:YVTN family beta-propeller protein
MRPDPRPTAALLGPALLACIVAAAPAQAATRRILEPAGFTSFVSPQSNPIALSPDGSRVFVANTTSNSVDVIDTATRSVRHSVRVGLEPVGLAVRPDGKELWVANHISDSISVIDIDPHSGERYRLVGTVQDLDPATLVTRTDEPVGIAFASDAKAYVTLSSRNQVAVVDVAARRVTGYLEITAQDPRAIAVRGGRLYVAAFESGNQTELSVCVFGTTPPGCTLDFNDLLTFITVPNLPGEGMNLVRRATVPDRDLFVFDTANEAPVATVSSIGTLLYGLAVDSAGRVFVAHTEARNDADGLAAVPPLGDGQGLADIENRMFLNRLGVIDCGGAGCGAPEAIDLEPAPPALPAPGQALATPFGVALAGDDGLLVVTAAASSRVFSFDPATRSVLDVLDVGAIPRGVALASDPATGAAATAWVLNTLGNSVSVVSVSAAGELAEVARVPVGADPTPEAVRRGRIAFESAHGSTSGTFSCGSCHPDGNTDQLLWVIGARCTFSAGCQQEEPRSTMPIRGLANTLPLHWDGTLGDPIGGRNGEVGINGSVPPNCDAADPHGCFRQLVDASMTGVMCDQSDGCASGGELSDAERDDMASFLASVAYPPARARPMDDRVSDAALGGFEDYFIDQGSLVGVTDPSTCADTTGGCHALPLGVSTNSPVVGAFDAPTFRGMNDRFLQFSLGVTMPVELQRVAAQGVPFPPFNIPPSDAPFRSEDGFEELSTFATSFVAFRPIYNVRPLGIFQFFEEAGTGSSGAIGRQLTLDGSTTAPGELAATQAILAALEDADRRGAVNLRGVGSRDGTSLEVELAPSGRYESELGLSLSSGQLVAEVQAGRVMLTLTAQHREKVGDPGSPQPLLATFATGDGPTGDPPLPVLPADNPMDLAATDVRGDSTLLVDGQPVGGSLDCVGGSFAPFCSSGRVALALDVVPASGTHLLQVQSPAGPISNELPFVVE